MKLENIFEENYCINLKSRLDRWDAMQNEFYKINFFPQRFEAITDENPVRGCYLSHLELLRRANASGKSLLVLEDDACFYEYEKDTIEKSLDELCPLDWWIFYLGANIMKPFYQVSDHLAKLNWAQSTHAYAINKKHLPEILDFVESQNSFIDVIYTSIVMQTSCYITIPMVSYQRTDYSDIEHCEMSYDLPIKRYWDNLVRLKK
jgi:GR25 family glycosyltransferase involved in LPS biosynthesis